MRARRTALTVIFASASLLALAYGTAFLPGGAPGWSLGAAVLGSSGSLLGFLVLGATGSGGRLRRLLIPFLLIFLLLVGAFAFALWAPAPEPEQPELWLGLPPATAVLLYGVGLLPLLILPLAYALTFDETAASSGDASPAMSAGGAAS
ncbi:MAG: hypothetical protein HY561_05600 [Gemmatimonadetes bacterium]|nr:hypothetical protein [Gemmatimonadota bacterium]